MMRPLFILGILAAGLVSFSVISDKRTPEPGPVSVGEKLFFDPLLSADRTISCATCHKPAFAFGDSIALTLGIHGHKAKRNTPSAMNQALQVSFFWDGRAKTLEEQALIPIENPDEMGIPVDSVLQRLNDDKSYSAEFQLVFHEKPNGKNLARAIAEYERTLETSQTPFDEWRMNEDDAGERVGQARIRVIQRERAVYPMPLRPGF